MALLTVLFSVLFVGQSVYAAVNCTTTDGNMYTVSVDSDKVGTSVGGDATTFTAEIDPTPLPSVFLSFDWNVFIKDGDDWEEVEEGEDYTIEVVSASECKIKFLIRGEFKIEFDPVENTDEFDSNQDCRVYTEVEVVEVDLKAPTLYMFKEHPNDTLIITVTPDSTEYEWSFEDSNELGDVDERAYNGSNIAKYEFIPHTIGTNKLILKKDGEIFWEKEVEILKIIPRYQWGAYLADKSKLSGMPTIKAITIHHSANTDDGSSEVKDIQDLHMSNFPYNIYGGRGWADIGYHYLMSNDGSLYEGRRLEGENLSGGVYTKGSHVAANNTNAGIGFCMLGNYEDNTFNDSRKKSMLKNVIALARRHKLGASKVKYHLQMDLTPTADDKCPGKHVIDVWSDIIDFIKEHLK